MYYREPVLLLAESLDADIVVLIDAVSSGAAAGTVSVREIDDGPLPGWASIGGTHAFGLGSVIELARILGRLQHRLVLVGVEAADVATGATLSTPVRTSVKEATDAVLALMQER